MAGRRLLRIAPYLVVLVGAVLPDIGWIPYLLGWSASPTSPLHSMALIPVLFVLGIASALGLCADYILE